MVFSIQFELRPFVDNNMYQLYNCTSIDMGYRTAVDYQLKYRYKWVNLQEFVEIIAAQKKLYSTSKTNTVKNNLLPKPAASNSLKIDAFLNGPGRPDNFNVVVYNKSNPLEHYNISNLNYYKTRPQMDHLVTAVLNAFDVTSVNSKNTQYWRMLRQSRSSMFPDNRYALEQIFKDMFEDAVRQTKDPNDIELRTSILKRSIDALNQSSLLHDTEKSFIFTFPDFEIFVKNALRHMKNILNIKNPNYHQRILYDFLQNKTTSGILVVSTLLEHEIKKHNNVPWIEAIRPGRQRVVAKTTKAKKRSTPDEAIRPGRVVSTKPKKRPRVAIFTTPDVQQATDPKRDVQHGTVFKSGFERTVHPVLPQDADGQTEGKRICNRKRRKNQREGCSPHQVRQKQPMSSHTW